MHHSYGLATFLLAHDPLSSLTFPMITHILLVASNLPIAKLVVRQWPTNDFMTAAVIHLAKLNLLTN